MPVITDMRDEIFKDHEGKVVKKMLQQKPTHLHGARIRHTACLSIVPCHWILLLKPPASSKQSGAYTRLATIIILSSELIYLDGK